MTMRKVPKKVRRGGSISTCYQVGERLYGKKFYPFYPKETGNETGNERHITDYTPIQKVTYVFGNLCVAETKKAVYLMHNSYVCLFTNEDYIIRTAQEPVVGKKIIPNETIKRNYYGMRRGPFIETKVVKEVKTISEGVFLAEADDSQYLVFLEG